MCCKFRHFHQIFTLSLYNSVRLFEFLQRILTHMRLMYACVFSFRTLRLQVVINHFCQSNNKTGLLWFLCLSATAQVVARNPLLLFEFNAPFTPTLRQLCLTAVPHITICVFACVFVPRMWVCMSILYSHLNVLPGCRLSACLSARRQPWGLRVCTYVNRPVSATRRTPFCIHIHTYSYIYLRAQCNCSAFTRFIFYSHIQLTCARYCIQLTLAILLLVGRMCNVCKLLLYFDFEITSFQV